MYQKTFGTVKKITRREILRGHDKKVPLSPTLEANLCELLGRLNALRDAYGKPMVVTSGYRPKDYNERVGGAPGSAHITCEAADFKDVDGELKAFCTEEILEKFDLYMEHGDDTPGWVHLQTRPTRSRIFRK